jgi:hypothetical protein
MKGLLPDHVLASRPGRTGVTAGYFDRAMRDVQAGVLAETLADPLLAELGVVRRDALAAARQRFMRTGNGDLGLRLFLTMQAELWMRARTAADAPAIARPSIVPHAAGAW